MEYKGRLSKPKVNTSFSTPYNVSSPYDALKSTSLPVAQPKAASRVSQETPKTYTGRLKSVSQVTSPTTKGLPEFLGGGKYNASTSGELVKTERAYGGVDAPGQYREHIFPVALGGSSEFDNIKVYGKELGAKKSQYENEIINQYKSGKLSLPEARGEVLNKYREIVGLVPPQGVMANLPSAIKETASKPFSVLKGLYEKAKEYAQPKAGEVRPVDVLREARNVIKNVTAPTTEDIELAKKSKTGTIMTKGGILLTVDKKTGKYSQIDPTAGVGNLKNIAKEGLDEIGKTLLKNIGKKTAPIAKKAENKISQEVVETFKADDVNIMEKFLDAVGQGEKITPKLETEARYLMEGVGLNPEQSNKQIYKVFDDAIQRYANVEKPVAQKLPPKVEKLASNITNEAGKAKVPDVILRSAESINPIIHQDEQVQKIFKNWSRELLVGEEKANQIATKIPKLAGGTDDILKFESGINTKYSEKIAEEFDKLFAKAKKINPDVEYKKNYIPQVYDNTLEEVKTAMSKFMKDQGVDKVDIELYLQGIKDLPETASKALKLNPFFTEERAFPNYKTAIHYGLTPKYTEPAQLLGHYEAELNKTVANRKFIDSLLHNKKIATVEQAGNDWQALTLPFSPKGYYAPPKLAKMLNGMFRNEEMLGAIDTGIKGVSNLSKAMQSIQLSAGLPGTTINFFATGVGLIKELTAGNFKAAVNFIRSNFNGATIKYFNKNSKYFEMMAEEGINTSNRAGSYKTIYKNLKNTKGLLKKLGFGWDKAFNEKTFNNLLPMNQLDTFKATYEGALKKGMSEIEAKQLAGDTVKAFNGLFENLGRGKGTEDALSATFFAPKFREGIINTLANTGASVTTQLLNPAYKMNRRLLAGMIFSYGAYNALNKELTGHYMWENPDGKEFDLMIPTKLGNEKDDVTYIGFMPSFLSFARNMGSGAIALAKGDTDTAKQKIGSLFSMPIKLATEVWANKDYFGREIYKETDDKQTKLKKIGSYMFLSVNHPFVKEVYKQMTTDKPLYQSISESMELPLKFSSYSKIEKQEFYKAIEEKKKEEAKVKQDFAPRYTEIRNLLEEGKIDEAQSTIDTLSDEEYKLYQSAKRADKSRADINTQIKIFNEYKQVQELIKTGNEQEAKSIVDGFTDEEYAAYRQLKNKLQ